MGEGGEAFVPFMKKMRNLFLDHWVFHYHKCL